MECDSRSDFTITPIEFFSRKNRPVYSALVITYNSLRIRNQRSNYKKKSIIGANAKNYVFLGGSRFKMCVMSQSESIFSQVERRQMECKWNVFFTVLKSFPNNLSFDEWFQIIRKWFIIRMICQRNRSNDKSFANDFSKSTFEWKIIRIIWIFRRSFEYHSYKLLKKKLPDIIFSKTDDTEMNIGRCNGQFF